MHKVHIIILCRVFTDAEKMLKKLESVCKVPVPESEQYLYLQVFSREDKTMYRVKVTEERVASAFHLLTPRTLKSTRGDFICFGRYYYQRIVSTLSVEIFTNENEKFSARKINYYIYPAYTVALLISLCLRKQTDNTVNTNNNKLLFKLGPCLHSDYGVCSPFYIHLTTCARIK